MPATAHASLKCTLLWLAIALLSACSSGAVRKQINPPSASIQQLAVLQDGQWRLTVRLQNFSNVPTAFKQVTAKLLVGGQDAGSFELAPAITIGPESADVLTTTIKPALGAKLVVASALAAGQSAAYALSGSIATTSPKGNYPFRYDSALNPAPGLGGVMR